MVGGAHPTKLRYQQMHEESWGQVLPFALRDYRVRVTYGLVYNIN